MKERSPNQCSPSELEGLPQVQLRAKPYDVNGEIEWALGFQPDPPRHSMEEVDLRSTSGAHDIIIHLVGAGPGIKFNICDPVWVCDNGVCPPPHGSQSEQIVVKECTDRKLTLHDKNEGDPVDLTYQLNFVGAKPLDPMIRNGGSV